MPCKNCNKNLSSEVNFCDSCGAKVIRNRLTIKNLLEHFSETYFDYDNKFLQTFITLFTQPHAVIGTYIEGTRKKYVNAVNYFVIALTLSGFQIFFINKFFPELLDVDFLSQEGAENFQKENMNFVQEYNSIIYILIVPIYALISKIVFLDFKKYNYTEHLVANMYLAAHLSIVSSIIIIITFFLGFNFAMVGILVAPIQIVFSAYCFKRLFNLNLKKILLRTILFLLIIGGLFIILIALVSIVMYYNGTMDAIIEAKKVAIEAAKQAQQTK
ncbi:DUF3667 domain-containing protein [Flavivirga amylovorans]|uniref:DUF3667 domain-containing protein n=1 Tax=Flavivirga amylovorans TaxID=870486 RepID=A0ABT8X6I4_9FLAO|nr:DUF3667 domain-containing protein [Flavivirga amylovorans]MDO5989496.1 DUF3667 domain-containing protein [Flavivirga amylovorans]